MYCYCHATTTNEYVGRCRRGTCSRPCCSKPLGSRLQVEVRVQPVRGKGREGRRQGVVPPLWACGTTCVRWG